MESMFDIYLISIYLFLIFCVGIWAGRRVKSVSEFAVADRSYPSFVLFATLSASFIGGGFSSGNAAKVFTGGMGYATTLWGFSLMLFLLSIWIAPKLGKRFQNAISAGDMMLMNYGKGAQLLSGLLGMLVCTGILAAQVGAMGAVFQIFLGLPFQTGAFLGCAIVILYTAIGGMKAVVLTDVIQFLVLIICIPLTLAFGVYYVGGLDAVFAKVPPSHLTIFSENLTPWTWLGLFLSFLLGETLVPPYIQRLLITKTPVETAKGTLYSALLSVPFFVITGAIGLVAFAITPDIDPNLAMPHLIQTVLPVGLKGLACAGIISVVMSSADSFLNSASVCFIRDLATPLMPGVFKKKDGQKDNLFMTQIVTLFIGFGATFLALKIANVLDILLFAYNFWAPVMLVPLGAVLIGVKASKSSFVLGAFCGAFVIGLAWIYNHGDIFGMSAIVWGVLANLIAFSSNHMIEKRAV